MHEYGWENEFCSSLKLPRHILLPCVHVTRYVWPAKRTDMLSKHQIMIFTAPLRHWHGFPWAPSLFDGGRDEQTFLDKYPWTIHVASLLLLGLSLSFPCKSPPLLLTPAVPCSVLKAMCFCNEGFHERRKHLPFLPGKVGLKGFRGIILSLLIMFVGLEWM